METTRIKWDESMLERSFSEFSLIMPKASEPANFKGSKISQEPMPESKYSEKALEDSEEWKDFANDIDWAMM